MRRGISEIVLEIDINENVRRATFSCKKCVRWRPPYQRNECLQKICQEIRVKIRGFMERGALSAIFRHIIYEGLSLRLKNYSNHTLTF